MFFGQVGRMLFRATNCTNTHRFSCKVGPSEVCFTCKDHQKNPISLGFDTKQHHFDLNLFNMTSLKVIAVGLLWNLFSFQVRRKQTFLRIALGRACWGNLGNLRRSRHDHIPGMKTKPEGGVGTFANH